MIIRSYKGSAQIDVACDLILRYKIYKWDGAIQDWCEKRNRYLLNHIWIAFVGKKPVGVFIFREYNSRFHTNCGTYVLPEFRRKKIGTKLISKAAKLYQILPWKDRADALAFYTCPAVLRKMSIFGKKKLHQTTNVVS